jgi:transglutaminase-like putative cysteine protease
VDTQETFGVVLGTAERFPPTFFLRETPLTVADAAIQRLAGEVATESAESLERLHLLVQRLHELMIFDPEPTHAATSAAEAFGLGRGVCQDYAHIFLAVARCLGAPSRYVSGYFVRADGAVQQEAAHAWVEAHVPDLGWVGFDPTNGISATEAHLRVALGLDYLDAAPVRGTYRGGQGETLRVAVCVEQSSKQLQS